MHHKDCKHEPWTPSEAADRTHPIPFIFIWLKKSTILKSNLLLPCSLWPWLLPHILCRWRDNLRTMDLRLAPHHTIQKINFHPLLIAPHFAQVEGQLEDYGPETVDPHQIQKSHLHPFLDQHLTVVRQVTQVTSILGHGF